MTRLKRCVGALVALGLIAIAHEASAQVVVYTRPPPRRYIVYAPPPRQHTGFYFRLALGGGLLNDNFKVAGQSTTLVSDASTFGGTFAGEIALGGAIVPGFILAGSLMWESLQGESITYANIPNPNGDTYNVSTLFLLGPKIDWYVNPHRGFHLEGAIGGTRMQFQDSAGFLVKETPVGAGVEVGIGYEFYLGPKLGLGFLFRGIAATMSDSGYTHNVEAGSLLGTLTFN